MEESKLLNKEEFHKLKKDYFIVKIAGKGNINDSKILTYLTNNIDPATKKIIETIKSANINPVKDVLIIWDGDDRQDNSPFTLIIKKLYDDKLNYSFAALKPMENGKTKWKYKHFNSWEIEKLKTYHMDKKDTHENFNLNTKQQEDLEPYIVNNKLCDMYVSYGASLFINTSGYQQLYGDSEVNSKQKRSEVQIFKDYKKEEANFYPFLTNYSVEKINNDIDGLEIFLKDEDMNNYKKEAGFYGGKKSHKRRKSKKNRKTKKARKSKKLKKTKSIKIRKSKRRHR